MRTTNVEKQPYGYRLTVVCAIIASCLTALVGCQGFVGSPSDSDPAATPGSWARGDSSPACSTPVVDATPLTRLTAAEYGRTVSDLIGRDPELSFSLVADSEAGGFRVGTGVPALLVEQYIDAAEEIAGRVAAENLDQLVPCATEANRDCAATFIQAFGTRAFRRPITDDEEADYLAAFDLGAELDFATGIEAVVASILSSPKFFYRLEFPSESVPAGETAPLDAFSLASRLSYFLWGSAPDDALLAAASGGDLDGPGLEAEARRMLSDPRSSAGIREFAAQWLNLEALESMERDEALFPEFDQDYSVRLRTSIDSFVEESFRGSEPTLANLFTANYVYADGALATVLGLPTVTSDRHVVDPSRRRGLLTQPAFMALHAYRDQSDPIHRGLFIRTKVFCHELPNPPDDVDVSVPEPRPDESTRERVTRLTSDDNCAGCHELLNPLGFGFEHYDAMGRWRADDAGQPIDASGIVRGGTDFDGPFRDAIELSDLIAQSQTVSECMALQWFRYGLGREPTVQDECSLAQIREDFATSGGSLPELLISIVRSDAFRHVYVQEGVDR